MDDAALAIAALDCGHRALLSDEHDVIADRIARSGRQLSNEGVAPVLAMTADAVAGADLIAQPIEISDHPLCVLGIVLQAYTNVSGGQPRAGGGLIAAAELSRQLKQRHRDGGKTLVSSLRMLHRLNLVIWDRNSGEVRVGAALAAQPPSVFASVARGQ